MRHSVTLNNGGGRRRQMAAMSTADAVRGSTATAQRKIQ